jgi:tetratricopeptide (TPR) repeat protein
MTMPIAKSAARLLLILAFARCLPVFAQDKAAVQAWKNEIDQGKKALKENHIWEASDRYADALALAEKFGADDPRLSETLHRVGALHLELREYPAAENAMRRAVAIDEKRLGTNDYHLIDEYLTLGEICAFTQKLGEADDYDSRAQYLAEWKYGKYDRVVGLCVLEKAKVALMLDHLDQSEKLFKEALEMIESNRSRYHFEPNQIVSRSIQTPNNMQVGTALNDLALVYKKEKKYGEAEKAFNRALSLLEHDYGKNSVNLCNPLSNLALVYEDEGKLADAERLVRRSLEILKAVDPENPYVLQTREILDGILKAEHQPALSSPPQNQ